MPLSSPYMLANRQVFFMAGVEVDGSCFAWLFAFTPSARPAGPKGQLLVSFFLVFVQTDWHLDQLLSGLAWIALICQAPLLSESNKKPSP